jgi:protein-S-isoprenylcysteine O-methyltransferase Ste14
VVSVVVLIAGVTIWIWSVALMLTKVPRGELITSGLYSLMKHPLYTGVALLVLPWIGFLLDTWVGALIGRPVHRVQHLRPCRRGVAVSDLWREVG